MHTPPQLNDSVLADCEPGDYLLVTCRYRGSGDALQYIARSVHTLFPENILGNDLAEVRRTLGISIVIAGIVAFRFGTNPVTSHWQKPTSATKLASCDVDVTVAKIRYEASGASDLPSGFFYVK